MTQIDSTSEAIKVVEEGAKPGHNLHEAFQTVEEYLAGKPNRDAEADKIFNGMAKILPRVILREGKDLLEDADQNQDKYIDRQELKAKREGAPIGGSHMTKMESLVLAKMADQYDQLTSSGIGGDYGINQESLIKYFKEQHNRRQKDEAVATKLDGLTEAVAARWGTLAGFSDLTKGDTTLDKFTLDWAANREQKKLDTQNEQLRDLEAIAQTRTNKTLKAKDDEEIIKRKDDIEFKEKLVKGLHVLSENFDDLKDANGVLTRDRLQAISEINAQKHAVPEPPQPTMAGPDARSDSNEQAVKDQSVKAMISTLSTKGNVNDTIKAINESIDQRVPVEHRDAVAAAIVKELDKMDEGGAARAAYLKANLKQLDANHDKRVESPELQRALDNLNGSGNGLFAMDAAILKDAIANYGDMSDKVNFSRGRGAGVGRRTIGISEEGIDKYDQRQTEHRAAELIEKQRKAEIIPEQPKAVPAANTDRKTEEKSEQSKTVPAARIDRKTEEKPEQPKPILPFEPPKPVGPRNPFEPQSVEPLRLVDDWLEQHDTGKAPVQPIEGKKPEPTQIPSKPEASKKSGENDESDFSKEYQRRISFNKLFDNDLQFHDSDEGRKTLDLKWQYRAKPEAISREPEATAEKKESKPEPKEEKSNLQKGSDDIREQLAQLKAELAEKTKQMETLKAESEARKQQQEAEERNRKMEAAKLDSGDDIQAIIKAARSQKDVENRHYIYRDENNQEINIAVKSAAGRAYEKWYSKHAGSTHYQQHEPVHHCSNGHCS